MDGIRTTLSNPGFGGGPRDETARNYTSNMIPSSSTTSLRTMTDLGGSPRKSIRRFKSRHVPSVAENVPHVNVNEGIRRRLSGLMAHLRENSVRQEEEHQILSMGVAITHEDAQVLNDIFERYCSIAERMNTELMSATKFEKLIEDVLKAHHKPSRCRNERTVVFYRVVHTTDPPSTKLDFEGFCKALGLLAMRMYPQLDLQTSLDRLVEMIVAASYIVIPSQQGGNAQRDIVEICGDEDTYAEILSSIKKYERSLSAIFSQFCGKNALRCGSAGDVASTYGAHMTQRRALDIYLKSKAGMSDSTITSKRLSQHTTNFAQGDKMAYVGLAFDHTDKQDKEKVFESTPRHGSVTDGFLQGTPAVKGWQRMLNFEQWRFLWKDLGVYPTIVTNRQLASVFKKSNESHSAYGFLPYAAFLEAVIRLAIECYSESPFKDEFVTEHERVRGFLHRVIGPSSRSAGIVKVSPFLLNS